MKIAIDASNITFGGGFTHLKEMLEFLNPQDYNIEEVIIYGGNNIQALPNRKWLIKKVFKQLDGSFFSASLWKIFSLSLHLKKDGISILFNPGGTYLGSFSPYVTMSQNMLVFDSIERARYGITWMNLKLKILNITQSYTFKRADGIVFISDYAKNYISKSLKLNQKNVIINHGISTRFENYPKTQNSIETFTFSNPFRFLYVSRILDYKHQWNVIEAISDLRKKGLPVELHLVGEADPRPLKRMEQSINAVDIERTFIHYHGKVLFEDIEKHYHEADGFIFASTCENMPNIVMEAMAAGLPIASSNYEPMPEFLKDAAIYFDPLSVKDISQVLQLFLNSQAKRTEISEKAFQYVKAYSWVTCASKTLEYLMCVYQNTLSKGKKRTSQNKFRV
jgi:glycosyltransferase involved in cell wall biosynthesis